MVQFINKKIGKGTIDYREKTLVKQTNRLTPRIKVTRAGNTLIIPVAIL